MAVYPIPFTLYLVNGYLSILINNRYDYLLQTGDMRIASII